MSKENKSSAPRGPMAMRVSQKPKISKSLLVS